jgi:hypothetical protein
MTYSRRPWLWASIQVVTRRYYNGSVADSEEKIGDMSLPEQAMNSWYSVVLLRMIAFHYRFRNPIHIIIFLHIIVYTSSPYWPCLVINWHQMVTDTNQWPFITSVWQSLKTSLPHFSSTTFNFFSRIGDDSFSISILFTNLLGFIFSCTNSFMILQLHYL